MERFLRKFNMNSYYANHVKMFQALSPQWTCSHLRRNCLFDGVCAKQHFEEVMNRITERNDAHAAYRLAEMAQITMLDREKVWLQCYKSFSEPYDENIAEKIQICGRELLDKYKNSDMVTKIDNMIKFDPTRIVLDDNFSAFPYLYIPVNYGQMVQPIRIMRYRQIGYCFYQPDAVDDWIAPDIYPMRRPRMEMCRQVKEAVGSCSFTGFSGPVFQIMFFPMQMLPYMENEGFAKIINRYAQMAVQQYLRVGYIEERRYVTQLFGECPAGEFPMHHMMLRRWEGNGRPQTLVQMRHTIAGNKEWQTWLLPMILVRIAVREPANFEYVRGFMQGRHKCQLCFLKNGCDRETFYHIDVRTSEMVGCSTVTQVMIGEHVDISLPVQKIKLTGTEHLGRASDHYFKYNATTGMEALIRTAIQIHRWIRGTGIWENDEWQEGIYLLARVLLRWELSTQARSIMFRLFCFVCFGYAPRKDGTIPDWKDLGAFLDIILNGTELGDDEDEAATGIMFELSRCVMTLAYAERIKVVTFNAPECDEGAVMNIAQAMANMWDN
uniref:Non-structural protein NS1 n=1 Tax=Epizootic hemorrhagic disease virus TaxID=40054 RepID=A0A1B0UG67_9REOV|nr:NS1 protein [Epizootic hemorrhagic disease virus]ALX38647.1 NS1 protein [Epizootic hemorrhagic disease virus]